MKTVITNTPDSSSLVVTLTTSQIREVIREEVRMALDQYRNECEISKDFSQNEISAAQSFLNVAEAAELARVAQSTIRLYIRKGELKTQKVGRRIIIGRGDLESFLGSGSRGKLSI
jgi:excisionase family DNA binding protein